METLLYLGHSSLYERRTHKTPLENILKPPVQRSWGALQTSYEPLTH